MNCPICKGETIVISKDGPDRRRKCVSCGHRFTTVEVLKDAHQRQQDAVRAVVDVAEKLKAA